MLTKTSLLLTSVFALTVLTGCASPVSKWSHPSASKDQWAIDKADCRSRASRLSNKEHRAENYSGTIRDDEFTSVYSNNMRTFDSGRRRQSYYEDCLKRLGYSPAQSDQ